MNAPAFIPCGDTLEKMEKSGKKSWKKQSADEKTWEADAWKVIAQLPDAGDIL